MGGMYVYVHMYVCMYVQVELTVLLALHFYTVQKIIKYTTNNENVPRKAVANAAGYIMSTWTAEHTVC